MRAFESSKNEYDYSSNYVPNIIMEKIFRKEEYLHMILLKNVLFVGRKLNIERVQME